MLNRLRTRRGMGGRGGRRAVTRSGQSVAALELLLDRAGQGEGLEAVPPALQRAGTTSLRWAKCVG